MLPGTPGNALHEQRHEFVFLVEAVLETVDQGALVHGTRVNPPDRLLEIFVPHFRGTLVRAEDALVLSREGIAESVFQQDCWSAR